MTMTFLRMSLAGVALGINLLGVGFAAGVANAADGDLGSVLVEARDQSGVPIGGACHRGENAIGLFGPVCDNAAADNDPEVGRVEFANLGPGEQEIAEVSAPPGFQNSGDPQLAVDVDPGATVTVVFGYVTSAVQVVSAQPSGGAVVATLPNRGTVIPVSVAIRQPVSTPPVVVGPAIPTCDGFAATIVGVPNPAGGQTSIDGYGGDDLICPLSGSDRVNAGDGDDVVFGGEGDDKLAGQSGVDALDGGSGGDVCHGGTTPGGPENDTALDRESIAAIP